MTETITIPVVIIHHIAEMRNAQKKGKTRQIPELERQVDLDLATVINALDCRKQGRWYEDIDLEVESRR